MNPFEFKELLEQNPAKIIKIVDPHGDAGFVTSLDCSMTEIFEINAEDELTGEEISTEKLLEELNKDIADPECTGLPLECREFFAWYVETGNRHHITSKDEASNEDELILILAEC